MIAYAAVSPLTRLFWIHCTHSGGVWVGSVLNCASMPGSAMREAAKMTGMTLAMLTLSGM